MGNYNLKNILLGIGMGLIVAAVLNISADSREMTVEEIKKEAAKHNLIVLAQEEIMDSQSPENTPSPTPSAEPTPTPTAAVTPTAAPSPTTAPPASEGKITVDVKSGMSSEDITDLLAEAGLLNDKKAFMQRLGELEADTKLKMGSFEIPKGSSHEAIIKLLTR